MAETRKRNIAIFDEEFKKVPPPEVYSWLKITSENHNLVKKLRAWVMNEVRKKKDIPLRRKRPKSATERSAFFQQRSQTLLISGAILQGFIEDTFQRFINNKIKEIDAEREAGIYSTNPKFKKGGLSKDDTKPSLSSFSKTKDDPLYEVFKTMPDNKLLDDKDKQLELYREKFEKIKEHNTKWTDEKEEFYCDYKWDMRKRLGDKVKTNHFDKVILSTMNRMVWDKLDIGSTQNKELNFQEELDRFVDRDYW